MCFCTNRRQFALSVCERLQSSPTNSVCFHFKISKPKLKKHRQLHFKEERNCVFLKSGVVSEMPSSYEQCVDAHISLLQSTG